MKNKFIIGVTGPSGAGKTTVCNFLSDHGYFCLNADKISKEVLETNRECQDKLVVAFGEKILDPDGKINRKNLARVAFLNNKSVKKLNNIAHSYIVLEILKRVKSSNEFIVVLDVPLLFESGLNKFCNVIVSIISDKKIRMKRVAIRDKLDKKSINKRFLRQKSIKFFKANSNYIIFNNSTKERLYNKTLQLFSFFRSLINDS